MMDLTGELLEVLSAARGYYQKSQEEIQMKREIEKAAREKIKLAKEQQEKLEKGVREAKRSFEKAVDSMPSGWDLLGMEAVETIVHGIFDGPGNSAPGGDRGRETGAEQSPSEDQSVPKDGGAGEQLKLYTTQLSEDLASATENVKGSKEKEPLNEKLQLMKVFMESLQEDLAGKDADSIDPEVQELLKQGLEISREGEKIASQLTGLTKQAANLKDKVMKFCTRRCAKTNYETSTASKIHGQLCKFCPLKGSQVSS